MPNLFDVIIVGGGPAGVAAGIYVARKQLKSLLITDSFGGQSIVSDKIENWIGEIAISGYDLAQKLEKHLRAQKGIEIILGKRVKRVSRDSCGFVVQLEGGDSMSARSVIIACGARRRRLGIPGEDKFDGRGVSFCSTCDAPLFRDKTVVVVGGGNAGLEAVIDLEPYAKKIYLLHLGKELGGDSLSQKKVKSITKATVILSAQIQAIKGDKTVEKIIFKDLTSGQIKELAVEGIFVEIGSVPNSEPVKNLVKLNQYGEIIIDQKTGVTSCSGIFAAGDVTDEIYKQNIIAAGDAARAALSAYNYLLQLKKQTPAAEC